MRAGAILAAAACMWGLPVAADLTPSEQLSLGLRDPTQAERESFVSLCARWQDTAEPLTLGHVTGTVVRFETLSLLPLLFMQSDGGDDGPFAIGTYPDLPHGGLSRMDFCDLLQIVRLDQPIPVSITNVGRLQGLRIKPGVDLPRQYPNAYAKMREVGQFLDLPAGAYFVLSEEHADLIGTLPGIDRNVPIFLMRGSVFAKVDDSAS
jgi:hypothetical protein